MHEPTARVTFDFAEALTRMKLGEHVTRLCWKGDGRHVFIWRQSNGVGFIRLSQYHGNMVEWQARDGDLLADDWVAHPIGRRG
jgi:hypothetical protein